MQFKYLRHDLYRYFYPTNKINKISLYKKINIIVFNQGIWATIVYRLRRWFYYECKYKVVSLIFKPFLEILFLLIEITTGIHIRPEIDIGPGLYIGHYGNIFLGGKTKIGKFCNISQEVTVGFAGRGDKWGLPEIGNFVYIAPGAKIIGKIKIGSNVAIGANAVVTKDVPDNAVVGGIPAKIINYGSSKDYILFNVSKSSEFL